MNSRPARHLRSNAIAYLALFVALGGTAMAGSQLVKGVSGDGSLTLKEIDISEEGTKVLAESGFARLSYRCNFGNGELRLRNESNRLLVPTVDSAEDGLDTLGSVQPDETRILDTTGGLESDRVIVTAQDRDSHRLMVAVVTEHHSTLGGIPFCRVVAMTAFRG